ncbi:uncharacterized protein LOC114942848 [Nylanderia fulva]|uniref:uncharacterized protein LOC114942848 n=1 Tax=Nylanderia fulva TaxID=613905 RepID=UPI0010FB3CCE|nr:uncharacterized protein LOC114942848 [Nylanderia fulva]
MTSAEETRKSRAMTNRQLEKKLKDLKKQYNIPEDIPIDDKLPITEFQLNKEKVEERKEAASFFLSEKPKSNKRRRTNELKTNELNTNEQKKDMEEIIFSRNFEELLHYSLECCLRYDIDLIKSLMNEIIAINSKHICGKITLYDAKLYISKLIDESDKLNKLRWSSSNIVEISPFLPRWAAHYMAHSYVNVNGLELQTPYGFRPFWNVTGSLNAFPHIDNLPKSSTEPSTESSICYRPV